MKSTRRRKSVLVCDACRAGDRKAGNESGGRAGVRRGFRATQKYGPDRLPTGGKRGPLMRFLMQINNVLIYALLGAALGKVFLGEWLDASVILGVVIINALLGFVQEGKGREGAGFDPQHAFC